MTRSRLFIVFAIAVAGLVGGAGTLQKGTVLRQLCIVLYYASSVYIHHCMHICCIAAYKPVCTSQCAGTAHVVARIVQREQFAVNCSMYTV